MKIQKSVFLIIFLLSCSVLFSQIQDPSSIYRKERDKINNLVHTKLKVNFNFEKDSTATIKLINYDVTELTYRTKTEKEQFVVFSEIYYKDGWNAYIDGKLTNHFRVNYVLRGMKIPAGEHEIEYKFEPKVIQQGGMISLFSYISIILVFVVWFFYGKKTRGELI